MNRPVAFPPAPVANWLLAGLLLVVAPHALHFPAWLSLVVAGMFAWRWLAAHGKLPIPGKWPLVLLAVAAGATILLYYHTLFGREAGVAMLTLMLALKLLEMRSEREAMLTVFLGYFLVITHFFYGQSLLLGAYLLPVILLLTLALNLINHPASAARWQRPLKRSALLLLQAIPLMLVLFVLFPRLDGPLWRLPKDAFSATSGLSDSMSPGSISNLVQSDAVAFRSEFEGQLPPNSRLYWRALTLDNYDGFTWRKSPDSPRPPLNITASGPAYRYVITIEPHDKHFVFALELPDSALLPANTFLAPDLGLASTRPIEQRTRYALTSHPDFTVGLEIPESALRKFLQLPARGNPKTRALAQTLRAGAQDDAEVVNRALRRFSEGGYVYTLTPPMLGQDGIDEFLFSTRQGFCEHYAGAFTFLMRAAGIPARVVTGYQGGEFNTLGNYLVVRQSEAHAWSEVWLKEKGWVRVDPTAAVSAERIENGVAWALPEGEPLPFLVRTNLQWLKQLRSGWDALNNQWNQWVIGYDMERQIGLFSKLGFGIVSWRELTWGMLIGIGLLLAIATALTLRSGRKPGQDRVQALYLNYCAKLEKAGLPRHPQEGPMDYARRVSQARPDLAAAAEAITRRYIALRYGRKGETAVEQMQELAVRVKRFRVGK